MTWTSSLISTRVCCVSGDRVVAAGWPLEEDLQDRPWGLTDFRILDPGGYYLRITNRTR
jgi:hypothetical protein